MKILLSALLALLGLSFTDIARVAPPNIIFIMTDQHVADGLSIRSGDRWLKTPALDGLARRGTFFTRAYAANPLCMPARNSIFTGRYPHQTGISDNTAQQTKARLDSTLFPTLGTHLKHSGYRTAYFGKWHLAYDQAAPETHGFETTATGHIDAKNADLAVQFLNENQPKPFALVVSFLNPHNVCELARDEPLNNGAIGELPTVSELPPVPANLGPQPGEPDTITKIRAGYHASPAFPVGGFTPERWQALRWGYYRLIEKVDAQIGKVLAAVRRAGLEDNTVIVFTSDHGECAGAHGYNQKTVFFEKSARVPLIVSLPGQNVGRSADQLVNVGIDILPTFLDFAGIRALRLCPARVCARSAGAPEPRLPGGARWSCKTICRREPW